MSLDDYKLLYIFAGNNILNGVVMPILEPDYLVGKLATYSVNAREKHDRPRADSPCGMGSRWKNVKGSDVVPIHLRRAFVRSHYKSMHAVILTTTSTGALKGALSHVKERLAATGVLTYKKTNPSEDAEPYTLSLFKSCAYNVDDYLVNGNIDWSEHRLPAQHSELSL